MTSTLIDSPYTFTTQAIVRLDPSAGRAAASAPVLSHVKTNAPAPGTTDDASLSHASLLIAHALTLSDVRVDKVASLQQAIAAGTYRISSDDLAGKLIATVQV